MVKLTQSLREWGSPAFGAALKGELEGLPTGTLPLGSVVGAGNRVYDKDLGVILLEATEDECAIHARVGVFFAEVISCVSCGEGDPIDEAYCEMQVRIDKSSAEASLSLAPAYC